MFIGLKSLTGIHLIASGDDIGEVEDFFFDDDQWVIPYLLVNSTGKVLVPTVVLDGFEEEPDHLATSLTRERLFQSGGTTQAQLDIQTGEDPEPDQVLDDVNPDTQGMNPGSEMMAYPLIEMNADVEEALHEVQDGSKSDLRSFQSEAGYLHVQGMDGEIGTVEDLIVDSAWQVLFLVIQCGLWLAGKKILVSPGWVDRVSESSGNLYLDITRQSAEDSPGYDPDQPVDRDLVERLADYYKDRPQTPEDET